MCVLCSPQNMCVMHAIGNVVVNILYLKYKKYKIHHGLPQFRFRQKLKLTHCPK